MKTTLLATSWWVLALRGVAAIAFGILALAWPDVTLLALVLLFAAYALFSGSVAVVGALRNRRTDGAWWLVLLLGIVGIAAGVIAVFHPALTALVLVLLMGANAIVNGVLEVVIAIRLRRVLRRQWLLALAGIVSIAFGLMVFLFPGAGALAMVWLIGVYAIVAGVLLLAAAWSARPASSQWHGTGGEPAAT
jgi:uncharacterized membrane protein HdeD (DUF308 family)